MFQVVFAITVCDIYIRLFINCCANFMYAVFCYYGPQVMKFDPAR